MICFHSLLLTWRLWAVGYYTNRADRNRMAITIAFGPMRFVFVRMMNADQRDAYDKDFVA